MEHGVFKNLGLKVSINIIYRRIFLLLFIHFILLVISYGFLSYQIRIINLENTKMYSVFQERELYISKFYNSINKNKLIQELYAITNDNKYLEIREGNFETMLHEFDSLYWYCRESEEYCMQLDSSRYFLDMYLTRLIPESDSILNTIRLHSSEKDKTKNQLDENLNIIENKIIEPIRFIVRSDRNETRLNQTIIESKIRSYHFWQKIVVFLVLGLIFLLIFFLVFILFRPLEKPRPVYNTLPDHQYSAIYEGFENELTEILQKHKNLFKKYIRIILIFPRGSFFPIEIISAFQKFCHDNNITFQVNDKMKIENLGEKMAFVLLEDETMATLVEAISGMNLIIGEQVGILAYEDSPLKRIVANGITVIDTAFQDFDPSGHRHMKPASGKCLRLIQRNSL